MSDDEKAQAAQAAWDRYRATHHRDGRGLGVHFPDNREGRRAIARSWKGADKIAPELRRKGTT